MTKKKIWVTIIGTGLVASLSTAAVYFPDYKIVLIAATTLISAIIGVVNGADNGTA